MHALDFAPDPDVVNDGRGPEKPGFKEAGPKPDLARMNTPYALEPLGGYAGKSPAERWAEGGRLAVGYGRKAPEEAKAIWARAVPMNADRWAALDRQATNVYRTLDALYKQTDPATGRQLFAREDLEHRTRMVTASKGWYPFWEPGRPGSAPNPVVHGVNALHQQERDRTPVLPSWAGLGGGPAVREMDIIQCGESLIRHRSRPALWRVRGRPTVDVVITDDERETLVRWSRRATSSQALALRCRIMPACADGASNTSVGGDLSVV